MKFDLIATREGVLMLNIKCELASPKPNPDKILSYIKQYEKKNLETIEKLRREKQVETNKIKGAIKNFLNAHPVLTKELIGSLTKRIMGSLLVDPNTIKKPKYKYKEITLGFFIGLVTMLIIYYLV